MKKRVLLSVLTVALLLTMGAGSVYAATASAGNAGNGYVDADGNGICDNRGGSAEKGNRNGVQRANFADADNDGICDNRGGSAEKGNRNGVQRANFADADNDGICDNRGDGAACSHAGMKMKKAAKETAD